MLYSCIFIFFVGVCWAVIDTILHHFDSSIFHDTNRKWSDPSVSWKNKYETYGDGEIKKDKNGDLVRKKIPRTNFPVPVFLTDAFHFFKGLAILFIFLSIVLYRPKFNILLDMSLLSVSYWIGFELFYSKLLRRE